MPKTSINEAVGNRFDAGRNEQNLCTREHGKLCFCLPKILSSDKNHLPLPNRSGAVCSKVANPEGSQITNRTCAIKWK